MKIFEYNKGQSGTLIDSVSKDVLTTNNFSFKKSEKGITGVFNGTTRLVKSNAGLNGVYSLRFWIKPKTSILQYLFTDNTAPLSYRIYLNSGLLFATIPSADKYVNGVLNGVVKANEWNELIVANYNLVSTAFTFGAYTGTGNGLIGDVAKFEIYDETPTASQRNEFYKEFLNSYGTEKPIRGFELVKPTDLSYQKDDKVGINITDNNDFDTWSSTGNAFVSKTSNSFTTNTSGGGVSKSALLTIGRKYRMTIRGTTTSGFSVTNISVSPNYATFGVGDFSSTIDFTASINNTLYLRNLAAGTTTITHLSIQEVTGLVAAYNMIPSNGTLVDISGNGNNGTINGAVIQSKEGLFTTDTTSNVLISAGPIITTNTYSVLGRIKINDLMASDGVLFSNDNTTTNEIIDSIGVRGGKLSWNYDTAGTYKAGATTDLPLNSYVDFAFVSDGGRSGVIKLYINGVEDTITSTGFYRSGTGSRLFARSSGTGFLGDCADFRIYNRVLSEQEVKDYHNSFIKPVILEDWSGSAVSDVI